MTTREHFFCEEMHKVRNGYIPVTVHEEFYLTPARPGRGLPKAWVARFYDIYCTDTYMQ